MKDAVRQELSFTGVVPPVDLVYNQSDDSDVPDSNDGDAYIVEDDLENLALTNPVEYERLMTEVR